VQAEAQSGANDAVAQSLRDGAQELIAANRIIDDLPAIVEAAAKGINGSKLTILNGTEGVGEVMSGLVAQGLAILDTLRTSTAAASHVTHNGSTPKPASPAPPAASPAATSAATPAPAPPLAGPPTLPPSPPESAS